MRFHVDRTGVPVAVGISVLPDLAGHREPRALAGRAQPDGGRPHLAHVTLPTDRPGPTTSASPLDRRRPGGGRAGPPSDHGHRLVGLPAPTQTGPRRGAIASGAMAALDAVFKAYDVRGTVPDQLDERACRAIGWAFPASPGPSGWWWPGTCGPRARPWPPPSWPGPGRRGRGSWTSGSPRPTRCTSPRAGSTHRGPCSPPPTTRPPTTGSSSAWPGPNPWARTLDSPRSVRRPRSPGFGGRPGRGPKGGYERADRLGEYADHVRSFVDVAALRPLRIVADTANGMGGLVAPEVFEACPSRSTSSSPSSTGPSPTTRPTPSKPENLVDLQKAVLDARGRRRPGLRRRRRPGLPRRREGRPGLRLAHHGAGGQGHARQEPRIDRPLQPDLFQGRPRDHRRERRSPGPDQGRTFLHQGGHGRDRGRLRGRALRATTTSGTTTGPTPGSSPPWSSSRSSPPPPHPSRSSSPPSAATPTRARSTPTVADPAASADAVAGHYARPGPHRHPRRDHRGRRRLVVQHPVLQHRASAPAERRSDDGLGLPTARRRGPGSGGPALHHRPLIHSPRSARETDATET